MADMDGWVVAFAAQQQRRTLNEWIDHANALEDKLAITEAKLAGALAIIGAFKQTDPNHPLLQPTNVLYTRGPRAGKPKNKAGLIWEQAFDAKAKEMGIANPAARRNEG